jgi:hypothetical protein
MSLSRFLTLNRYQNRNRNLNRTMRMNQRKTPMRMRWTPFDLYRLLCSFVLIRWRLELLLLFLPYIHISTRKVERVRIWRNSENVRNKNAQTHFGANTIASREVALDSVRSFGLFNICVLVGLTLYSLHHQYDEVSQKKSNNKVVSRSSPFACTCV